MDRITLKGIYLDDKINMYKIFDWRNDPHIYRWCRQETVLNFDQHKKYWEKIQRSATDKMFGIYRFKNAICFELVGVCGLTNINWTARHGEFSLYIGPEFQQKGYGRAALRDLFDIGFNDLGLRKIWGESFDGNPAIDLFKQLGLKESSGHQDHYLKDGQLVSTKFYTLFNPREGLHEIDCRDLGQP